MSIHSSPRFHGFNQVQSGDISLRMTLLWIFLWWSESLINSGKPSLQWKKIRTHPNGLELFFGSLNAGGLFCPPGLSRWVCFCRPGSHGVKGCMIVALKRWWTLGVWVTPDAFCSSRLLGACTPLISAWVCLFHWWVSCGVVGGTHSTLFLSMQPFDGTLLFVFCLSQKCYEFGNQTQTPP